MTTQQRVISGGGSAVGAAGSFLRGWGDVHGTAAGLGVAPATGGGLGSGHEPDAPGAFAGLRGGPAEPGPGAAPAGHFPTEPVPAQRPAGGAFDSASGSAVSRSLGHPVAEPSAGAPGQDPDRGAALAGHDQPGLDEPGGHAGIDLAAVDPAGPGADVGAAGAGEHEEAGGAHLASAAGWAPAPAGHDPGADGPVVH